MVAQHSIPPSGPRKGPSDLGSNINKYESLSNNEEESLLEAQNEPEKEGESMSFEAKDPLKCYPSPESVISILKGPQDPPYQFPPKGGDFKHPKK
jgi:hypothetical protein